MSPRSYYNFLSELWDKIYLSPGSPISYQKGFEFIELQRKLIGLSKTIWDVACGTGLLLKYFEDFHYNTIYGSDISNKMILKSKMKLKTTILKTGSYSETIIDEKVSLIVSFFNSFS